MDDKTELALTRWFNSFSGDHGKTEWEALVEIVIAALTREREVGAKQERAHIRDMLNLPSARRNC